jgi:hypothetical protein
MPNLVQEQAISAVEDYLERKDYTVEDIRHSKQKEPQHRGYTLVASKAGGSPITINVKGTTKMWGIPDVYVTEFDDDRRLVADYLYVVFILKNQSPRICAIPRDALKSDDIVEKHNYRFKGRIKKQETLERYLVTS